MKSTYHEIQGGGPNVVNIEVSALFSEKTPINTHRLPKYPLRNCRICGRVRYWSR